ncbi:hypothetical protein SAMN05216421_2210 [Halopseudomonas xinjiangensis]|uniref:Uncharacterized protein n=1 Tax=Halopseudomonas xinjiangensis TaxID=487184 RepID=A0A1H1V5C2_9GAMM|nr:hypothetical protein [Halopseudomonas xinjiangensis]SDS79479.1 hypothetical protein SAMN05216421_2210 [Halopseudomonas xinjiangensis]
MRLDGQLPFNSLVERSRSVAPPASSESARPGHAAPVEPTRALTPRAVVALSANAEYIPARRESSQPVYGRVNQALASYESTANLPLESEVEGIFGVDLYA